jgi:N-acylglucosamine 2-epimerase
MLSNERLKKLDQVYRDGLLCDVVPFWLEHGFDKEYGGIMTGLDRQGRLIDTDKGVWQQGRFAWTLGFLANKVEARPEWVHAAKRTLEFVRKYCYDPADGRMYFHMTRRGDPIRKRRYAFSESFMCIACGEYARLTQSDEYAELARKTYKVYGDHVDFPPKFTDIRPARGLGHPMINIVTCQRLRESIGYEEANDRIDQAIADIKKYHMKPDLRCVMETVSPEGEIIDHINERTLNPGHAIEGAWFIMNEGKMRGRPDYIRMGLDMLDWSWERGWDKEYGGIIYYRDVYNHPVSEYWQDMKFWWPQNETLIATLLAYQLTGDEKYAKMHTLAHDWTYAHFPDKEFGDWFGYLARDGRVCSDIKGNLYKGCFHVPRMQYECWKLCEELLAKGPLNLV